ncbi:MAG TPA: L-2-amino-thiazoline-4-carboxylic acid hydrolase [Spirochaetales bacterium]|nr:L-2-amino-thiazoline-4-carboxylic acid hydrolase [Spirochaetales bacterium]
MMSNIKNKATLHEDKIELARSCIEHRATWMALTYAEMEKAGVDAEKITRAAVRKCGNIHGLRFREQCKNPDDLVEFAGIFLTEDGRKNFEMNVHDVDHDNIKSDFHYCPLVSAWQKLGLDDDTIALFCDIAMDGDRGIAESMRITLDLGDTIAKGCDTCKLHFHK